MNDELTKQDIEKMQAELDFRRLELMPELLEEVKRTRAFGDLSENFEYKDFVLVSVDRRTNTATVVTEQPPF